MLDEALEYLQVKEKHDKKFKYELIIVDDGSKDKTTEVCTHSAAKRHVFSSNEVFSHLDFADRTVIHEGVWV